MNKEMKSYTTLSQAMNALRDEGYVEDFNLKPDGLICNTLDREFNHNQFEVDKVYRFEGDSNPDDNSILFAISSDNGKIKGILVDAYGAYADPLTTEMIRKLRYEPN
jgi:hypothetical protein